MKTIICITTLVVATILFAYEAHQRWQPPNAQVQPPQLTHEVITVTAEPSPDFNEQIDYGSFLKTAAEVQQYRASRRLTEQQFLSMASPTDSVVLDTRSERAFTLTHIEGAVHLSFSDITKDSLAALIPSKETRILIYCNNNFRRAPEVFPMKTAPAALNIPTFITLYEYGYRNLYELGPVLDIHSTEIPLIGSLAPSSQRQAATTRPVAIPVQGAKGMLLGT